jgi:hypothetical protein
MVYSRKSCLLAHSFLVETALSLDPLSLTTLEQAFLLLQERLRSFANEPDFSQKLALAFGNSFDAEAAQGLAQAWRSEDFRAIPTIEVISASQLNGANGAFASSTNRIYLSQELLSQNQGNLGAIASVLLEEYGHSVDGVLNSTDAPGDEGAIFSALVRGESLSDEALGQLKAEDDSGVINLDGQIIKVEQSLSTKPAFLTNRSLIG